MITGLNSIALSIASYKFRKASFDIIYDEFKRIDKIKTNRTISKEISFKKNLKLSNIDFFIVIRKRF